MLYMRMPLFNLKRIKMKNFLFLILAVSLTTVNALSDGILKGKVFDAESGEELIGATVVVNEAKGKGARSDINGKYQISLKPGTYSITVKYISYADSKIEKINIEEGAVKTVNVAMAGDDVMASEIVIEADRINNNEAALLSLQKNSVAVQDGISAEQISKLGASNSAESMKQVTGASIEGGKYVVMRGLGDRYSISQLNGTTMPSTDPYRNSSNMELISSNMIENIVTKKTFTPDQPGNFTGGNVDITTKSLPDKFYANFGMSAGYNTVSSFNDNFLSDPINGSTDFLGIDDGSRALPEYFDTPANRDELTQSLPILARNKNNQEATDLYNRAAREFNTPFIPETDPSLMNLSTSIGFGDRFDFGDDRALGYNFSFNFSRGFSAKENWELQVNEYNEGALRQFFGTQGFMGSRTATWGGILSMAYQFDPYNEISIEGIFNHDGEEQAGSLVGSWQGAISTDHTLYANNIAFIERDLLTGQLKGKHILNDDDIELKWLLGITGSSQYEPDGRAFTYFTEEVNGRTNYVLNDNELQFPFHFYRDLTDIQYTAKADIEIPFGEKSSSNSVKFGFLSNLKVRDFSELRFQLINPEQNDEHINFTEANGDFDLYFGDANFGTLGDNPNFPGRFLLGNSYVNMTQAANRYTGIEFISGAYAMSTYELLEDFKVVGGLRVENTYMNVEAGNDSTGTISVIDPLPSLGLIYSVTRNQNFRLSGSRTVARPNLRELAPFSSIDFIGGFFYTGNPSLERTNIWNADFRWEWFQRPGEVIAVSLFYKHFTNPIVRQINPVASGGQVQYINVTSGFLRGLEFEARTNLDIITEELKDFNFSFNLTLTQSETELDPAELEQFRTINPDYPETRPFIAQSPFIANTSLGYTNPDFGTSVTLSANVWGARLSQTGFLGGPDLYEIRGKKGSTLPTPDLGLNFGQQITDSWKVTLGVNNILNAPFYTYQEYQGELYTVDFYEIGQTFSLGIKYSVQ
ncbi:MAG: TonB-dependent receptor [Candidatus Kapaibacteriales bacterium]